MEGARVEPWTMQQTLAEAPVSMLPSERLLLYALVRGLRPRRSLEIGTLFGGSALIIGAALDEIGEGALICVDPEPQVSAENWRRVAHRATLLTARSPEVLATAQQTAGGRFDFVLIDGDHSHAGALRDINGTVPVLADRAYVIFHDAHFPEVASAIDAALQLHPELEDCGTLTADRQVDDAGLVWGGLRLLRFTRTGTAPAASLPAAASDNGSGDTAAALASIIGSTTGLGSPDARRAAEALLDPAAYPIDYLGRIREAWIQPDREFVAQLFQLLLGRAVDAPSSDAHCAALASGTSRLAMIRAIATAPEAAARGLPTAWLDRLATLAPGLEAAHASRPTRLVDRLARSARRALRLPWIIEQIHLLGTAQGRQIAEQDRRTQETTERVAALAHEQRLYMATTTSDWNAARGTFVDQQRTLEALRAEVESLAREVRTLTARLDEKK